MTAHQLPGEMLGLSRIAQIELELRQAENFERIDFIAVNDTHRIVEYDHAIIWRQNPDRITAISGGLVVDRNAPQIVWFNKLCRHLLADHQMEQPRLLEKNNLPKSLQNEFDSWCRGNVLWVPLIGAHRSSEGGLIIFREPDFSEPEQRILGRIGNACGHACSALRAPVKQRTHTSRLSGYAKWAILTVASLIILNIPLPITVLGDARIAPASPILITAPLNAVIKNIHVPPNSHVERDTPLFSFDKTEIYSAAKISDKRVTVLLADRARAEQKSFNDAAARAELSLVAARLAQTYAELDQANEKLSRTDVRSPGSGIILFDNPENWEGRPVQLGEKIMLLANPEKIRLEIEIPIDEALIVEPGAEVRFFLAVSPSEPVHAELINVSYSPKIINNQKAVFIGQAEFQKGAKPLRLGLTGTAKIIGPSEPLYFILMRKPLSALRRFFGI